MRLLTSTYILNSQAFANNPNSGLRYQQAANKTHQLARQAAQKADEYMDSYLEAVMPHTDFLGKYNTPAVIGGTSLAITPVLMFYLGRASLNLFRSLFFPPKYERKLSTDARLTSYEPIVWEPDTVPTDWRSISPSNSDPDIDLHRGPTLPDRFIRKEDKPQAALVHEETTVEERSEDFHTLSDEDLLSVVIEKSESISLEESLKFPKIPGYQILMPLGQGGMGTVYLALHNKMKSLRAIKVIKKDIEGNGEWIQRFEAEARANANVDHPNVVTIHDFSTTKDGQPYIVLKYYHNGNLNHWIKDYETVPELEAVGIFIQLARGLEAIHEAGLIHRDIKPANIFISKKDIAALADFGLAKAYTGRVKTTENVMGTPAYMPIEQLRGKADTRSDIYALGATLYKAVTGENAYKGKHEKVIFEKINGDIPDPRELRPDLSRKLAEIIMTCLAKEPEDRYQTAQELLVELEALEAEFLL